MKPIRNIVVATDFSAASRPAFERAMEMAAANGAALWISHVAPLPPDGYGLPRMYDEMDVAIRSDAEKSSSPWCPGHARPVCEPEPSC